MSHVRPTNKRTRDGLAGERRLCFMKLSAVWTSHFLIKLTEKKHASSTSSNCIKNEAFNRDMGKHSLFRIFSCMYSSSCAVWRDSYHWAETNYDLVSVQKRFSVKIPISVTPKIMGRQSDPTLVPVNPAHVNPRPWSQIAFKRRSDLRIIRTSTGPTFGELITGERAITEPWLLVGHRNCLREIDGA